MLNNIEEAVIVDETDEGTTQTRNWKKYVKPAAFVVLTAAILTGAIILSREVTANLAAKAE